MKVLFADSHSATRRFVRAILSSVPEIELFDVHSVDAAIESVVRDQPALLLLALPMQGIEMPERGGIEILQRVRASGIKTPTVFITDNVNLADIRVAMQLEAKDYVLRSMITPQLLVPIVERIRAQQPATGLPQRRTPSISDRMRELSDTRAVDDSPKQSTKPKPPPAMRDLDPEEAGLLALINEHRMSNGVEPLVAIGVLNRVAREHSMDMATRGYFSHRSFDGDTHFDRMQRVGYTAGKGENIAAGHSDARATFYQWRNSPGHNANMLNRSHHAMGIGRAYAKDSQYGWYWTSVFGTDVGNEAESENAPVSTRNNDCTTNEPLPAPGLFGRLEELKTLERFLTSDRKAAIVTGAAGIGKTTIVRELVSRSSGLFSGNVVYVSAREIPFNEVNAALVMLAVVNATQTQGNSNQEPSARLLSRDISEMVLSLRGLVVIDDLDDVNAAEIAKLASAFQQSTPAETKALFVVRERPPQLDQFDIIDIGGLDLDAATKLVEHLAEQRGVRDGIDTDEARSIASELRGHPLALDLAVNIAVHLRNDTGVSTSGRRLWNIASEPAKFRWHHIVRMAATSAGKEARALLERIISFPSDSFTRDELEAATCASMLWSDGAENVAENISMGLASCMKLGLLIHDQAADVYRIHNAMKTYLGEAGSLRMQSWAPIEALSVFAVVLQYVRSNRGDFSLIDHRFEHVIRMLDMMSASGIMRYAVNRVFPYTDRYLRDRGRWYIRVALRARQENATRNARVIPSPTRDVNIPEMSRALDILARLPSVVKSGNRVDLVNALGILACEARNLEIGADADALRNRAADLAEATGATSVLQMLATNAAQAGDVLGARMLFSRALDVAADEPERLIEIVRHWAQLEGKTGGALEVSALLTRFVECSLDRHHRTSTTPAEEDALRVQAVRQWMQVMGNLGDGTANAVALFNHGLAERDAGHIATARVALGECVRLRREQRRPRDLVRALMVLGEMELNAGYVSSGIALIREAAGLVEGEHDAHAKHTREVLEFWERTARGRRIARAMTRNDAPTNEPAPSGAVGRARRIILRGNG